MKTASLRFLPCLAALVTLTTAWPATSADNARAKLNIRHDRQNHRATISWDASAGAELGRARNGGTRFERMNRSTGPVEVELSEAQMTFALVSTADSIVSENMVGFAMVDLQWGMSLLANPFNQSNNTLSVIFPTAPDGAQVLRLVGNDYDTSVFSAQTMTWTKPAFDLSPGVGFFFVNPSREAFRQFFIGEVLLGSLTNNLPAGISLEGSMLPQAGSINTILNVPGHHGDVLFVYQSGADARGQYQRSTFSAAENAWVPDLSLGVAQGFWIQKRQAQDWVRHFSIGP